MMKWIIAFLFSIALIGCDRPTDKDALIKTIKDFENLLVTKQDSIDLHLIEQVIGKPYDDTGSGIHILMYQIQDGSIIRVGTTDMTDVLYIDHLTDAEPSFKRLYANLPTEQ